MHYIIVYIGEDAIIHFPSDGKSETVTIRGKEGGVKAAKKAVMAEAAQLRLQSFNATVQAAPEFHRFLIGRGGTNMKEIRDKTGCRIAVPGAIFLQFLFTIFFASFLQLFTIFSQVLF